MKTYFLTIVAALLTITTSACPVCEKQQPKLLQGISHGIGPQSNWDYALVWATAFIVLLTLFYTIKWLRKPGEDSDAHIKKAILNEC
ncbi:hypothetical protein AAE02nite_24540 [Adhaeribacter aerolatus]|uniref:Cytochrome c oxidase subunit II n=1 Tax=Adhaeribacter aerolatus TaxID=670289 RepID=A0A512AYK5_9BACT|nr:hypothetical protein [Adhaeribacter aerolatus]GEO04790.1 hypothetical protein AAE02nite_24540 [Adhaeribacter aerolatus]